MKNAHHTLHGFNTNLEMRKLKPREGNELPKATQSAGTEQEWDCLCLLGHHNQIPQSGHLKQQTLICPTVQAPGSPRSACLQGRFVESSLPSSRAVPPSHCDLTRSPPSECMRRGPSSSPKTPGSLGLRRHLASFHHNHLLEGLTSRGRHMRSQGFHTGILRACNSTHNRTNSSHLPV